MTANVGGTYFQRTLGSLVAVAGVMFLVAFILIWAVLGLSPWALLIVGTLTLSALGMGVFMILLVLAIEGRGSRTGGA